ncbi:MAG: 4Fe-4S binding protein [Sarcina sp.]
MSNIKRSIAKLSFVRKMVTKKGSIVNDIDKCILCGKCEKACPLGSITIDKTAKK